MAERLLYLIRHGEADGHDDVAELTDLGVGQARRTRDRLADVPFHSIHHSPLRRATSTARIIAESQPGVPVSPDDLVGDYIPSDPAGVANAPPAYATFAAAILSLDERSKGPLLAAEAHRRFANALDADTTELIVSHNFTIGGFVCAAVGASPWRWMTLHQANCGITIIRYRTGLPPALVAFALAPRIAELAVAALIDAWPEALSFAQPTGYRPLPNTASRSSDRQRSPRLMRAASGRRPARARRRRRIRTRSR